MIAFDDWNDHHAREAARQGWQLVETGFLGNAPLEIKCVDVDTFVDSNTCPIYTHDEYAVRAFRSAFESMEDHALLAFRLIRIYSPKEYDHWRMAEWPGR